MATEITGGNTQVGTLNRQFIETNNNNNISININVVHCTASHQHQHQEGVSISGGDLPQLMDTLKSIVESCGQTSQIKSQSTIQTQSEAAVKSDSVPTQTWKRQVRKGWWTEMFRKKEKVNTDSVRIVDPDDQVLEPGDAVWSKYRDYSRYVDSVWLVDPDEQVLRLGDSVWIKYRAYSLYVGDGYVVYYNEDSQTVVKEKLDLTQLFFKSTPFMRDNVNVFPPEQRVQRALRHVGKPCPDPSMTTEDFVCWIYIGLNSEQCIDGGFWMDSVRIVDSCGWVLEPGDAVKINFWLYFLYVGDGYVVYYNEDSQIVVKEKVDLTQPFMKLMLQMSRNLKVFPPEQRVQRALRHVGKPCPDPSMTTEDFVCWTFTGLNCWQCIDGGFWMDI